MGTSTSWGPNRSSWPTTIDAATRAPRLHQFRPTIDENRTARATPATTLDTRLACRPTPPSCTTNPSRRAPAILRDLRLDSAEINHPPSGQTVAEFTASIEEPPDGT